MAGSCGALALALPLLSAMTAAGIRPIRNSMKAVPIP